MKFSRVIGKIDTKLVEKAEEVLSSMFLEFGLKSDNVFLGKTKMGGDPLIFTLLYPVEHICTLNIETAATDGKRFYWNPKFVLKHSANDMIGLRLICGHEAWHAIYMHPQRRGSRLPKLWNIAVDYIVNGILMEDLKIRKKNPAEIFTKYLGKFKTLEEYANLLKDPFKSQGELNGLDTEKSNVELPAPDADVELTPEQIKELEKRSKREKFYFADPNLSEDMKRPEQIYEYLYALLPKCPKCGSVGVYKLPKKGKNKDKNNDEGGEGKDGQSCSGGCPECGGGIDIFDLGGTVDDHMDTTETEEKMAKRLAEAIESTRRMAGSIPGALEEELGKLTAPKITWQDVIRSRLLRARSGNGRNDWTRFRNRPMFSGLLVPKKKNFYAHFGCLLDTSGSMSGSDMAFGISQLAALDDRSEGTIVPADAQIYWDKCTKIKNCNAEELSKVKICGRGGTVWAPYFSDYEKHIGKCDFLIIISDLYLMDTDIANMKDPGIDVYWLCTSENHEFKAPFGKVLNIRN